MGMLTAFAPFIVFAVLDRIVPGAWALLCGALVCLVLLVRDGMTPGRHVKSLEVGTFVLFAALAAYTMLTDAAWSVIGVRLCVDAGLLLLVVSSIVARRPFTLQYAREQVPQALWNDPAFVRTNYVISGAWALAFLVMVLAELALLTMPDMPRQLGIVLIVVALVGAFKFTAWYTDRVQAPAG